MAIYNGQVDAGDVNGVAMSKKRAMVDQGVLASIKIEVIPWEECGRLVETHNPQNRHLSQSVYRGYRADVEAGRWHLTHEGIAFGPDGEIIDGQHRMWAHYLAKRDFKTVVARYAARSDASSALGVCNTGKSRSTSDVLSISGVMTREFSKTKVAMTILMHDLLMGHSDRMTKQVIGESYAAYEDAIKWAAPLGIGGTGAPLRASMAISWMVNRDDTEAFAGLIVEGAGTAGSAAALWNKLKGTALAANRGGSERRAVCYRALRILKAHINHEATPSKVYTSDESLGWFLKSLRKSGVRVKLLEERASPDSEK